MSTVEDKNKAIVREAFDTLFNKRDHAAAERFWSPDYIQHSARIAPGREGLFDLVKSLPAELKRECELIMAEGDMVMVRGRFSGRGQPAPWIAADFVRRGRHPGGALGRDRGGSLPEGIPERRANVRRRLPRGALSSTAGARGDSSRRTPCQPGSAGLPAVRRHSLT
ncbi:nuclear transport factor 2 family protein [Streptomyces mirabilis]|uniref:nuclear transport factor 2 family protein n=1 Tax=Streptomyces mirabilis TaxID=68239 RepID=UPI003317B0C1